MTEWAANFLERFFGIPGDRAEKSLHRIGVLGTALLFVLVATLLISFDSIFITGRDIHSLQVDDVSPQNILAPPEGLSYESAILTQRAQQEAANTIFELYDPPDTDVARQQSLLARQILDYIQVVRRDSFGSLDQKADDLNRISALTLEPEIINAILNMSAENWQAVSDQIEIVLERVMRQSIRESALPMEITQLPTQVSIRFSAEEAAVVVAVVEDLIRANTFPNTQLTEEARQAAIAAVEPVIRTFAPNEILVRENKRIDVLDYEALGQITQRSSGQYRSLMVGRAFLGSVLAVGLAGLYIRRFRPELLESSRFLLLLTVILLIVLTGAKVTGLTALIYLYPLAALALIFASLAGPAVAVIGTVVQAFMVGLMMNNSLEIAVFTVVGGLTGLLALRKAERLNNYFIAGLLVSVVNAVVITLFNNTLALDLDFSLLLTLGLLNGIITGGLGLVAMYLVTLAFNLPTSMKIAELSQPNNPLLQRLLREAPGTYQHSLQVANLTEQAALAIGANAELVRVASLYHDIGKMNNPAFFSENQQFSGGNPHDVLDDPYRSADIIIGHVTEGDVIARQYRLPKVFRDFILQHHGTTQVFVFYRQAVNLADGRESAIDIGEFTYPGPKPQSREAAIMMLADASESAVRSIGPTSKQEVSEIIQKIITDRLQNGQLDESGLTLNDIKAIRISFVGMLQAVYHPRIDYRKATTPAARKPNEVSAPPVEREATPKALPSVKTEEVRAADKRSSTEAPITRPSTQTVTENPPVNLELIDDESPLPDVPTLPRTQAKNTGTASNGTLIGDADEEKQDVRD